MENLKNKLDKYEIKDEKNKYVFRADFKYMISSSIFFIIIAGIAIHSLYKGISGAERLTLIKIIFIDFYIFIKIIFHIICPKF